MATPADPRRRTVVGLAGAGLACPLLAACGADTARDPRSGASRGSGSSPSPSPAPTEDSETPEDSGTPEPAGKPLVATAAVPVGGGKILADQRVVVTQPRKGDFRAFTAVCTHQGCVVASVNDRQIVCYCHGSRFGIADGAVEMGPAQQPLAAIEVTVADGEVRRA